MLPRRRGRINGRGAYRRKLPDPLPVQRNFMRSPSARASLPNPNFWRDEHLIVVYLFESHRKKPPTFPLPRITSHKILLLEAHSFHHGRVSTHPLPPTPRHAFPTQPWTQRLTDTRRRHGEPQHRPLKLLHAEKRPVRRPPPGAPPIPGQECPDRRGHRRCRCGNLCVRGPEQNPPTYLVEFRAGLS